MILLVGLAAAGTAASVTASALPGPSAQLVGANVPVDRSAYDPLDTSAHNSPSLAANPRDPANLVVADRVDAPQFSCSLHVSFDGGATWTPTAIPSPDAKVVACFTPDVSFGPDGRLYVAFVSFAKVDGLGTVPDGLWVATSHDGGRSLSRAVAAAGPSVFHARVLADPVVAGRVYATWVRAAETGSYGLAGTANPVVMARSDDGGVTWGEAVVVSPPSRRRPITPVPAVGLGGRVLVAYLDVGDDRLDYEGAHEGRGGDPYGADWSLAVASSADHGRTWSDATVDTVVPTRRFLMLFPPAPALAVDRRHGEVYVAFQDGRDGDADVRLWRSGDATRWSEGGRVNDTVPRDGRDQYLAALSVAPGGRLDAVYYDRRGDRRNVYNQVSLQSSFDAGRSFSPRLRVSDRSFDSTLGYGRDQGLAEMGHRLAVLSTDRGALAVWADTRAGDEYSRKQALSRQLVAITPASPLRSPLRGAGIAAVAVSLLAAAAVFAGARRGAGAASA